MDKDKIREALCKALDSSFAYGARKADTSNAMAHHGYIMVDRAQRREEAAYQAAREARLELCRVLGIDPIY